jgi:hypothetical protein
VSSAWHSDDVTRHYGKYRGVVTAVDDTDGRHQGTIMVSVPAVLGADAKVPARACMPYGHFFVPPVGAHVWVEFEGGDIGMALWVGVWYPEGAAPVEAQVDPPDHRVIQTPAGHTIEIVDRAGEERILIRHSTEAFVSIDKNGSILLSNPNGSHLHLDGDTVNVAAAKVVVQSQSVALGAGATDPTIMGNAFKALWMLLVSHVHPTAVGPSGPSPGLATVPSLIDGVHLTSEVRVK